MLCCDSLSAAAEVPLVFDFEAKVDFLGGSMPKSVACLGPEGLDEAEEADSRSLPLAEVPVYQLMLEKGGGVRRRRKGGVH